VTIQQIGFCSFTEREKLAQQDVTIYKAGPEGVEFNLNNPMEFPPYLEREDDISSCCYFYLDQPRTGLPALDPVEKRTEGLLDITVNTGISGLDPQIVERILKRLKDNSAE